MDRFDKEILQQLQNNSSISTETLGAHIGLSASSCQRRIKKLKQSGVIQHEVVVVDRTKLPSVITTIVEVTLDKGGEAALDQVIDTLNKEQQVQQLYYMAGDVDFVAILVNSSMDEFDVLSRKLFMSNPNIKKFTSKVVIKPCKANLNIPINNE